MPKIVFGMILSSFGLIPGFATLMSVTTSVDPTGFIFNAEVISVWMQLTLGVISILIFERMTKATGLTG